MDRNEVIKTIREFISKKFPLKCSCCGKHFSSFKDYFQNTSHVGKPVSYDAEENDWRPKDPLGTSSIANCSCGSTITIDTSGMELRTLWKLMSWARTEIKNRDIGIRDVLEELRDDIDRSVLRDNDVADDSSTKR